MIDKCVECGGVAIKNKPSTSYKLHFGLDKKVTLQGIDVATCAECGAEYVDIPRIRELHAVLANRLGTKRGALTSKEAHCLGKWMVCSGVDFVEAMTKKLISAVRDEKSADAVSVAIRNHQEMLEKMQRSLDRRLARIRKS